MLSINDVTCKSCDNVYEVVKYKWCKLCQIINLKQNFENWTSGNEEIDELIQEMQLKIKRHNSIIAEWISYNQFNDIKEIYKDDFITLYSATWINGPLEYELDKMERKRVPNKKVALKCLYNLQDIINEFLNEVKLYSTDGPYDNIPCIYGITQNPDTKNYILVLQNGFCEYCGKVYSNINHKWCNPCRINRLKQDFKNWTSGNEKIDELIQEMQLKINTINDIIFEWIPYNQFHNIKEIHKDNSVTLYSAIWIDGPLECEPDKKEWRRMPKRKVALKKYLHNSQNITNEFLNEVKLYSTDHLYDDIINIYGMTQDPDTKDYIMVLQDSFCEYCNKIHSNISSKWCKLCRINKLKQDFKNWTSGNEKIDELIQEMQLKIKIFRSIIVEWIPYDQFNGTKEIYKDDFITLYSATWIDGPLKYDLDKMEWERVPNKEVALKCLYNSQNNPNEFINKVKSYFSIGDDNKIYGISQNPDTKDYIIVVFQDYCKKCGDVFTNIRYKWCKSCQINNLKENFANWTSKNEKFDNLIHEMQLRINNHDDIVVEWIPYNQFNYIKKIGEGGFATVYSAVWMDGPLNYDKYKMEYKRTPNKEVALKDLYNSQNIASEFLNEVKKYSINVKDNIIHIYGISQNPDTKDYVIVLQYAGGGNFNSYVNKNFMNWFWHERLDAIHNIIKGLRKIHENEMVHRDFHTGNILLVYNGHYSYSGNPICIINISDMGLCEEASNTDKTNIYGVMPYVAPEVLRGNPYTQAADIYSFGMIMYFIATGMQPFADCTHDQFLALSICDGDRPKINEPKAPKCYIELMKRCWDPSPDNRPSAIEIEKLIESFYNNFSEIVYVDDIEDCNNNEEIKRQFEEAEEYRKTNLLSVKNNQLSMHPQAYYTSRLLNSFTKYLTECLECSIND